MKEQITRARYYFNLAEKGASQLDKDSRWPVITSTSKVETSDVALQFTTSTLMKTLSNDPPQKNGLKLEP